MVDPEESIDIYDASLRPRGRKERLQAHFDGDWHRTFHCWVVRTVAEPALLFQRRASVMRDYPDKWDVSAAGHLLAGESVMSGVREVREELGIDFEDDELISAGERVEVQDLDDGQRNREYQSVFFLETKQDFSKFSPQVDEVSGLLWLPILTGAELFEGKVAHVRCESLQYSGRTWRRGSVLVSRTSFVPRIQRYYLASLIAAERLCDGKTSIAIS